MALGRRNVSVWLSATVYFATALAVLLLARGVDGIAVAWVADAFLLAFMTLSDRRRWPLFLVAAAGASIAANMLGGNALLLSIGFTAANLVNVTVALGIMSRLGRPVPRYEQPADLVRFLLACCVVAPALSAGVATGVAYLMVPGNPLALWQSWFASCAIGALLIVPLVHLVAASMARGWRKRSAEGIRDAAILFSGVAAVTVFVFAVNNLPLAFLPLAAVIIAVVRFGRLGAAISVAIVAVISSVATYQGHGPFAVGHDLPAQVVLLQIYFAVIGLIGPPVAAILDDRAQALAQLRTTEAQYRLLVDHSADALLRADLDGVCQYMSPAAPALIGFDAENFAERKLLDFIEPEDKKIVVQTHLAALADPHSTHACQYRVRHNDGQLRWLETRTRATLDGEGATDGVVSIIRDVTARIAKELDLTVAINTDTLTGLHSRRSVHGVIGKAIEDRRPFVLAMLDLDHFKQVNDTYGHAVGDALLKEVAKVLADSMRSSDLVARLGGEEFIAVMFDLDLAGAHRLVERLRLAVAAMRITLADGSTTGATVSIGLAASEGLTTIDAALDAADRQLYRAKKAGRNRTMMAS